MGKKGEVLIFMRKTYSSLQITMQVFIPQRHIDLKGKLTTVLHRFKCFGMSPSQLFHSTGEFSVVAFFLNVIFYYKNTNWTLPSGIRFMTRFTSSLNGTGQVCEMYSFCIVTSSSAKQS